MTYPCYPLFFKPSKDYPFNDLSLFVPAAYAAPDMASKPRPTTSDPQADATGRMRRER
jgi:hypothetical protein